MQKIDRTTTAKVENIDGNGYTESVQVSLNSDNHLVVRLIGSFDQSEQGELGHDTLLVFNQTETLCIIRFIKNIIRKLDDAPSGLPF